MATTPTGCLRKLRAKWSRARASATGFGCMGTESRHRACPQESTRLSRQESDPLFFSCSYIHQTPLSFGKAIHILIAWWYSLPDDGQIKQQTTDHLEEAGLFLSATPAQKEETDLTYRHQFLLANNNLCAALHALTLHFK